MRRLHIRNARAQRASRLLLAAVVTAGASIAVASTSACGKPAAGAAASTKDAAPAGVDVRTDTVRSEKVPHYLTLTGSVVADRSAEVAANVSGRVVQAAVERGQSVKKGDVIVRVDSEAASFNAAMASAQAGAADTNVEAAKKECVRTEALFKGNAITGIEYDRQKSQCQAQLFSAEAARANASLATKMQKDASIRAPFDGVVGERYVNVGEYLQPTTRVASLMAVDPVRVSISVPEHAVGLVKAGQVLDVEVAAYPDKVFPATVRYVAPALRANSRDLIIEATATGTGGLLKPGMFATVRLSVGDEEQPTLLESAIRREGTTARVFVVRDGRAEETVIRTGVKTGERIAVLDSLPVGALVVVTPPPTLRDGAPVSFVGEAPAAAAPAPAQPETGAPTKAKN